MFTVQKYCFFLVPPRVFPIILLRTMFFLLFVGFWIGFLWKIWTVHPLLYNIFSWAIRLCRRAFCLKHTSSTRLYPYCFYATTMLFWNSASRTETIPGSDLYSVWRLSRCSFSRYSIKDRATWVLQRHQRYCYKNSGTCLFYHTPFEVGGMLSAVDDVGLWYSIMASLCGYHSSGIKLRPIPVCWWSIG